MDKSKAGVCHKDVLSYKSISDRWKNNRQMKSWFDALSEQETIDWYVKQQQLPAGTKRKFTDVQYTEGIHDKCHWHRNMYENGRMNV